MYKVFFNDRVAFFGEDFSTIDKRRGNLFYRFTNSLELQQKVADFFSSEEAGNLYISHEDLPLLIKEFKSCFVLIEAGGGLVFNRHGEFLVIARKGKWDLPKGKLEKGEDFETAALREVGEETGLKPLDSVQPLISTYHTYKLSERKVLKRTRWFELYYPGSGEPVLEAEEGITDFRWVKPARGGFILKNTYGSVLDVLTIRGLI